MRFTHGLKVLALASVFAVMGCDDDEGDSEGSGSGGSGGDDRASTILGLTGDVAAGESVFTGNTCNVDACHGSDGTNGMGPNLSEVVPASDDTMIVDVLLNGGMGMPPQSSLSDQELADVLAYMNANFG